MRRSSVRRLGEGLVFVSPFLVGFTLLTVYAVIKSFHYSFTEFNGVNPPEWVGLDKYRELALDRLFWLSLWNTVYYTVFAVPLGLCLAMILALLLNLKLKGIALYRALFFVPSIVPLVASSVLWLWFLNPQYGALNGVLRALGLPEPGWLGDPAWVKPSLILMSLWGVGGTMVLYLAALQDVPEQLYEAAEIDGAGAWQRTWHITLPTMSPVILATLILGLIGGFQYFTQAYVMLAGTGGPGDQGLFYCLYLFRKAFAYQDLGGACAMAWILFVIVVALTLVTLKVAAGRVHYEGG